MPLLYTSFLGGGGGGGSVGVPWTYSGTQGVSNPGLDETFPGFDIGEEGASRVVVVIIGWSNSIGTAVSSLTIGGVSASAVQTNTSAGQRVAIYYAVVPTGTTASVAVTFSGATGQGAVVSVYYGYPATSTPRDSGTSNASSGGVITVSNLEIAGGGVLIAGRVGSSGRPASFGWTGVDSVIVDNEQTTNIVNISAAHIATTEATTDDDLTCDPSGTATNAVVAATWV